MDILNEIIEASNHMIDALEESDFFLENPFLEQIINACFIVFSQLVSCIKAAKES